VRQVGTRVAARDAHVHVHRHRRRRGRRARGATWNAAPRDTRSRRARGDRRDLVVDVQLCLALSHKALTSKGASHRVSQTTNEKFTFRVWLVGLGLKGKEFKTARKHLIAKLSGNSAWRYGQGQQAARRSASQETRGSAHRIYLENRTDGHHKFYRIEWTAEHTVRTTWGRIGTEGRSAEERLSTDAEVAARIEAIVKTRRDHGYTVITYLHEFAHALLRQGYGGQLSSVALRAKEDALGHGERGACRWSINLFRRVFPAQYARRCPDSRPVSRGVLKGYRFAFRGYGHADIVRDKRAEVWGALYEITERDAAALDRYEACPP